ncbi:chaplin [Streptomyces sp. cg35]|uniref:chaplin n=1 Tax=Streptomyces sp. cg35 TaxID=3421650 RepID=UPI003D1655B1
MMRVVKTAAVVLAMGGAMLAGAGVAAADSEAQGAAVGSPGVLSGNVVQVPVHVPVNACGNSVNVIGALNPAFGNTCVNGEQWTPDGMEQGGHEGQPGAMDDGYGMSDDGPWSM